MIIRHGNLVLPDKIRNNCDIRIEEGVIQKIGRSASNDGPIIDASDLYVCPGFVDIHTHGGGGGDFMDAVEEAFESALDFHAGNGTTSILATSVTALPEQIIDMLRVTRRYMNKQKPNCRVLGAHIEGPYISKKNKGAQPEAFLRIPSKDPYDFILDNSDVVKTVTIAPELDGAEEMTRDLRKAGIVVCGGHDDGYKEKIMPIIEAGLSHCTHLWCAMSSVAMRNGRRSVGLLETGLVDERLSVELIADDYHITPEMAKLVYQCKGADKMCVVSDSLRAAGMPEDGHLYSLGLKTDTDSQKFIVADGVARLPDHSHYAGSICPLSKMVRHLVFEAGISLVDAVKMASLTPARIIHADQLVGSIETGKAADFCLMDKELKVVGTIVGGRRINIDRPRKDYFEGGMFHDENDRESGIKGGRQRMECLF